MERGIFSAWNFARAGLLSEFFGYFSLFGFFGVLRRCSRARVGLLPIWEGHHDIKDIVHSISKDVRKRDNRREPDPEMEQVAAPSSATGK